ncbi:alpha/beta hydrolase [Paenibacillus mucilaginosus]|nr:prolyl oligopeptidase family serine peptidase [Paenibacillus mucilaginosus]MCG7215620.1 alpha/beta hydrolase [Paenibacillus mucilaginosus]
MAIYRDPAQKAQAHARGSGISSVVKKAILSMMAAVMLLVCMLPGVQAAEQPSEWTEAAVQFTSEGLTLNGTLLLPDTPGPHPAVVLVHGSNSVNREKYRGEAELFARAGIAALIYDKRKDGFASSRSGGRSYDLLAADAGAAVEALRTHPRLNPEHIGLWGISEGAWVASLTASRSDRADFLITVGASGVAPVRQQSWQLVNRLQGQGVSSPGVVEALSDRALRLAVSAGMFAEADYNPLPAFEGVKQPVLAIWGRQDRIEPPLESYRLLKQALEKKSESASYRFFDRAGHNLRSAPDGVQQTEEFPAGYADTMTSWVKHVTSGQASGPQTAGDVPQQEHLSKPGLHTIAWYQTAWAQLGTMLVLVVLFLGCWMAFLRRSRRLRREGAASRGTGPRFGTGGLAAGSGLLTVLGFTVYFGWLMSSGAKQVAPIVGDRPLVWLLLQLLAVITCGAAAVYAFSLRKGSGTGTRMCNGLLLGGVVLFAAWAAYWQLFSL